MENVEVKVAEMDVRLKAVEGKTIQLEEKVDDIHRLASSVEIIANDMSYMKSDISEMKAGQIDLKENQEKLSAKILDVENAPDKKKSKLFDNLAEKLVWLFVGGIAAFLLAQILPNIFK
jgi:hypothetical protein